MGLRCLLGHDFGEPETERERNEEGNEVVVTVREVKTCERCGEKQVVSENKEITSIDQLRESAAEGGSGTESTASTGADTGGGWGSADTPTQPNAGTDTDAPSSGTEQGPRESSTVEPDEDPVDRGVADIIEQAERDDDMLEQPPEEDEDVPVHPGQRSAAAEDEESPDPESDDGVILDDDEASPPEEGRRQWEEEATPEEVPDDELSVGEPSASDSDDDDDAEIIDAGGSSSEPSPEPSEPDVDEPQQSSTTSAVESEDAEIMDAGPEQPSSEPSSAPEPDEPTGREETDEGHMPWPEGPGEDEGHDATAPDDIDIGDFSSPEETGATDADRANGDRTESGEPSDASAGPTANVDLERSSRDAELEYYCPECGLTRDVGNSSMRAGDICPECRVGYITEQQKAE